MNKPMDVATLRKIVMNESKPVIKLVGQDGNAFAIMGQCERIARKAGWNKNKIDIMMNEMMSSDYNNLLQTAMKYFDVE